MHPLDLVGVDVDRGDDPARVPGGCHRQLAGVPGAEDADGAAGGGQLARLVRRRADVETSSAVCSGRSSGRGAQKPRSKT